MQQILIDFGTLNLFGLNIRLQIYGYGLMLVFGFLAGIWLARWRTRRMGESREIVTTVCILALVGGVVGARLAYVIQYWERFASSPGPFGEIFNVTSGGLIYYGGLLLATAMVVAYLWRKGLPIRRYLDIVSVSLMVGLAFGRAGCLLNGCCYGARCSEHWPLAMRFPMYSKPLIKLDGRRNPFSAGTNSPSPVYAHYFVLGQVRPDPELLGKFGGLIPPGQLAPTQVRIAEATRSRPVRPAQALGIANALLIAGLLLVFFRCRRREGHVFALLLVLYPITRFCLEGIRSDTNLHMGLTHNQYTSLATMAAGIILFGALGWLAPSLGPTRSQRLIAQRAQHRAGPTRTKRKR
ncbi:MAG: prolipoprotein diacylglyceryl transferase [Phycisphaerae bacterium]|jgi:phosphatidylglycerol:prolipoprotein diacylglycerol transferase|nr:prolipoprotein diacylglyceryl transferase [Phycisphaerae bacterium]MDP7637390.1 prolipoprotein diacylglyceryl transferase [Phycisphaerae bacterium]